MKQIFTRFLMLAVLFTAAASVVAQKSVLDESFASGQLPKDWTQSGNNLWKFEAGVVEFEVQAANATDTLFTPFVSLSELDNVPSVSVTYTNLANGSRVNELHILYRFSATGKWTVLASATQAQTEKTILKEALPDGISQVQVALVAVSQAGGKTSLYRLAIENKTEAAEAPAGLMVTGLTTNSATLEWVMPDSKKFQHFNLKVSTTELTDPSSDAADVLDMTGMLAMDLNDEFYTLTGLSPNTVYHAYVQTDCGDNDLSPWAYISFQTSCPTIGVPYFEDFENELSLCYTIHKDGSATTAAVSSEYPYNSTKSFNFVIGSKGFYNYLVLPELNVENLADYQISFMAAAQETGMTYARTIAVGVCTSTADVANTFTEIAIFELPTGRKWEQLIVSLANYKGEGKYIALRAGNAEKACRLFVDNISVDLAASCPRPMFLTVQNIQSEEATVSWVKSGSESEWNIVVSTSTLSNIDDFVPNTSKGEFVGSITSNPYTIKNLLPSTVYYVYLQAGCGSSEWTEAYSFKTIKEITYPYFESFDRLASDAYNGSTYSEAAMPEGWVVDCRYNNTQNSSTWDRQYISSSYMPFVTTAQNNKTTAYVNASLVLKGTAASSSTSTGYTSIVMLPAMKKELNQTQITMWVYSAYAMTLYVGVADVQTAELNQGEQLGKNITKVSEIPLTANSKWTKVTCSLAGYKGTGKYITLWLTSTSTPTLYIDDIEVNDISDCIDITDLAAEATSISTATVTWRDDNNKPGTQYKIKVNKTEINPETDEAEFSFTTSEKKYDLTGLDVDTKYYIYVTPNCDEMWQSVEVTTLYAMTVPYFNDFTNETAGSGNAPAHWMIGNASATASNTYKPYVYNTAWTAASGTTIPSDVTRPSLYFYATSSTSYNTPYAIMPEIANADIKNLKISFYGHTNNTTASYGCSLSIGVATSGTDFSTVEHYKTITLKARQVSELFIIDMSEYKGTGKNIVFYIDHATATSYFMIDNLSINFADAPMPLTELAVSDIKQTEAKVSWKENGIATKWDVKVFTEVPEDVETASAVFSQTVTGTPSITITGLKHSTQYYVYARSVQDNGNGNWASTSFWTETGVFAVPFVETFNNYASGSTSNNTLPPFYTVTTYCPYVYNTLIAAGVRDGYAIRFGSTSTSTSKISQLTFPEFEKPIKELQMTMYASPYSGTSYIGNATYTQVGVVEEDGSFTEVAHFTTNDAANWTEWFVNFGSYQGTGKNIAIRHDYDASGAKTSTYIYIDDITIEEIPACGRITSIDVNEIDSISATIEWVKGKDENDWNLKVSSVELTDPETQEADIFDGVISGTPKKEITDLVGNTTYYVYVQSVDTKLDCKGGWSAAKTFKTLCQIFGFPYFEDFEGYPTGSGSLPDCSYLCGEDDNHSYVTTKGTNNKALYLRQVTKDHNNYFAFPALKIDDVRRLQLSMQIWGHTTSTLNYYDFLEIGVMTDPNDPATFVSVYTDSIFNSNDPYDRVYTFDGYLGDATGKRGTFIALHPLNCKYSTNMSSTSASYFYIDNVEIDFIETCAKPYDLVADKIGINDVTISFTTDDEKATHLVRIFDNAVADPNSDSFVAETKVNANKATLSGLKDNTVYYAYVRKECAENDLSKWSSAVSFRTECALVASIPYVDDFESYVSGNLPFCWTSIDGPTVSPGTGSSVTAKITASSSQKHSGNLSLSVTTTAGTGQYGSYSTTASAVTPAFDVESVKDLLVYFYCKAGSGVGSLRVEAVNDETGENGVYLTTIENITASEWQVAYLDLADYYTSAMPYKRLLFRSATQGVTIYIDDIVVTKDKGQVLSVENLKALMLTENTIKFSFVEPTPTVKEWQVAYVETGGSIEDATKITVQETEVTLTNLAQNTTYDIYVRGNIEGDEWVGPLTVSTIQKPDPLPFITGFEDETEWNIYNRQANGKLYNNFFIIGPADSCGGSGLKALYTTNDSISYQIYGNKNLIPDGSVATSYAWATHNIQVEAGTYNISVKVKLPSSYNSQYIDAHLIPAGATFNGTNATLLSGATRSGSAVTNANGCYSAMPQVKETYDWTWVTTTVDVEESGIYTFALYWYIPSTGADLEFGAAVDSVIVEEYLCTTPKKFDYVERKPKEVTIKWFGGACKEFEYVVSEYGNLGNPAAIELEDKVAFGKLTDGPKVTIPGLQPCTNYYLYVRTICPEDQYTDWISYKFTTPCELEAVPYTESFTETPPCWVLTSATVGTTQVGTGSTDFEVWNRLLVAVGGMAILPELDVDINKLQVEIGLFNTATSDYGELTLGVMDNTWDPSTFKEIVLFKTQTKPSSSGTYTPSTLEVFYKMMNLYQGTGKVLALKNNSAVVVGVKYVRVTELPDCVPPQQVETISVEETEAKVTWLAGVEEAWDIMYVSGNDTTVIENVTEYPYTITGLSQGTTYNVYVRAICDANSKSEWSQPTGFQTTCGVNALPMSEDFYGIGYKYSSITTYRASLPCWENMVSQYPFDNYLQFPLVENKPYTPASNVSASHLWISNFISYLGDKDPVTGNLSWEGTAQLMSYRYVSNANYRYKYFASPQYKIDGSAALIFDIRRCKNTGDHIENPAGTRTMVLISTDNGETWKAEDAIDLTNELDSAYTTMNIPLDKYVGQTIRFAFYDEYRGSIQLSGNPFILIDNVRLSCIDEYRYEDNACEGTGYEGYGFTIEADDLPQVGTDSTYVRSAESVDGLSCDSLVYLTLTVNAATEGHLYVEICQGESYEFGGVSWTGTTQEGNLPSIYGTNINGCDSITYLHLTVKPLEIATTPIVVSISQDKLPYQVDEFYTVPANTPEGTYTEFAQGEDCTMNIYQITVLPATGLVNLGVDNDVVAVRVFDCAGRLIIDTPAAGTSLELQLPAGVYMLGKVRKDGTLLTEKLIVR